jgi:hypothetical protein
VNAIVYDLRPHWLFQRDDDGQWCRLDELEAQARRRPRISGHAVLDGSPRRVLVNISIDGLSLWDVPTRIAHRWADRTPRTVDLSALKDLLHD